VAVVTGAYCAVEDLVVGNVPLPSTVDVATYIISAADEIDVKLGSVYATPIIPDELVSNSRIAILTLKNINAHLASGRLLTALTAGGEDTEVHAYGLMLIRNSLDALKALATGSPELYGAPKLDTFSEGKRRGGVYNVDAFSAVEAFNTMTSPTGLMPYGGG